MLEETGVDAKRRDDLEGFMMLVELLLGLNRILL